MHCQHHSNISNQQTLLQLQQPPSAFVDSWALASTGFVNVPCNVGKLVACYCIFNGLLERKASAAPPIGTEC
jgi:hypothetical protein